MSDDAKRAPGREGRANTGKPRRGRDRSSRARAVGRGRRRNIHVGRDGDSHRGGVALAAVPAVATRRRTTRRATTTDPRAYYVDADGRRPEPTRVSRRPKTWKRGERGGDDPYINEASARREVDARALEWRCAARTRAFSRRRRVVWFSPRTRNDVRFTTELCAGKLKSFARSAGASRLQRGDIDISRESGEG